MVGPFRSGALAGYTQIKAYHMERCLISMYLKWKCLTNNKYYVKPKVIKHAVAHAKQISCLSFHMIKCCSHDKSCTTDSSGVGGLPVTLLSFGLSGITLTIRTVRGDGGTLCICAWFGTVGMVTGLGALARSGVEDLPRNIPAL